MMETRPRKAPKYCQGYLDRHGKPRWYLRRRGMKNVALPGLPWSPEFMAAYEEAMRGEAPEKPTKGAPGSIDALVASYYRTADYTGLGDSTKTTYRGIIERFRAEHGDKRVAKLQTVHVRKIIGDKSATPSAANNLLRMMHLLMRHAVELGWRKDDPTAGVRKIKITSKGFKTWEEEHIEQFVAHHGRGSRAVLALELLVWTGQRRSDVVRMGRQNIRDGVLTIAQKKTKIEIHVPVVAGLRDAVESLPPGQLHFLITAQGKPFKAAGFTNWFRDMVMEAGLPKGLTPHGLRKATARRLAEAGCSANQIQAVLGHQGLAEAALYTKAADRKRLAQEAMRVLEKDKSGTSSV